jgi:dTDP-4-amino-4,6-dideoxygalactose transaminase
MKCKILWDNDILLDLLLLRIKENPYILEIEKIFLKNKIPIYISSSQLLTLKNKLLEDLKSNNNSIHPNKILERFVDTHIVRILKTPSYFNISNLYKDVNIEHELIRLTAEAFDLYVLTRNDKFLENLKEKGIHPKNLKSFLKENIDKAIPMLNLVEETLYLYVDIEKNLDKVIKSSNFILGPEVKELEEKVAKYLGVKYCVGCSSGTDALLLSLRALAIKIKKQEYWDKEDLIITTPFTFVATGDVILRAGATPLFVDIELDTYTLDPDLVKKAIKNYEKRVKGIIPVHLYGHPCDMDELISIAKEKDLFIIEDCAQSFGASWDNKKTGSLGDLGCFSFFPSKNLSCFGDGGMISTNDDDLTEIIRMLIKHGGKNKYNSEHIGYNARLDTIQSAVLLAKFKYIDELNNMRRKIAQIYNEGLKNVEWLKLPIEKKKAYHVYHQYTVLLKNKNRKEVQEKLKQKGISTMVYYPYPLHKMKVFKNNRMVVFGNLRNSEIASENVLSLPIEPLYDEEVIKLIIQVLKDV